MMVQYLCYRNSDSNQSQFSKCFRFLHAGHMGRHYCYRHYSPILSQARNNSGVSGCDQALSFYVRFMSEAADYYYPQNNFKCSAQWGRGGTVSPCWCRQPGQSDLASGFDSRSKGKEFAIPNAQECVREDAGRYRAEAMASRLSHFEAAARRKAVGIGEVRVVG